MLCQRRRLDVLHDWRGHLNKASADEMHSTTGVMHETQQACGMCSITDATSALVQALWSPHAKVTCIHSWYGQLEAVCPEADQVHVHSRQDCCPTGHHHFGFEPASQA